MIESGLLALAQSARLPIVAANDVYFAAPEMHEAHDALLCIAEGCYYSCLCRPDGEGRWRAFHSADPFLVQELVAKLQERYQLQQRIG